MMPGKRGGSFLFVKHAPKNVCVCVCVCVPDCLHGHYEQSDAWGRGLDSLELEL